MLERCVQEAHLGRLCSGSAQSSKAAGLGCLVVLAHAMQAVHQVEASQRAQHVVLGIPLNSASAACVSL